MHRGKLLVNGGKRYQQLTPQPRSVVWQIAHCCGAISGSDDATRALPEGTSKYSSVRAIRSLRSFGDGGIGRPASLIAWRRTDRIGLFSTNWMFGIISTQITWNHWPRWFGIQGSLVCYPSTPPPSSTFLHNAQNGLFTFASHA